MKNLKIIINVVTIGFLMLSYGCRNEKVTLTNQQEKAKLLNGSWGNAQIVSAPVLDATGTLTSLVLTFNTTADFNPSTFIATGAPAYFPSGTTWTWTDATTVSAILLEGTLPVTAIFIDELTTTHLTISFTLNGPIGGRISGVGAYQMQFTKL